MIHGDCLEILPTIPRVTHVVTDPPYDARTHAGALTVSSGALAADASTAGVTFDHLASPSDLARALLRVAERWVLAFGTIEAMGEYARGAGDAWVRAGVWDRINPAPQLSGDRPAQAVEAIAIMHAVGRKRWNGGGTAAIWRHAVETGAARPKHPTPKPVSLMIELLSLFTDAGDLVLDPFAGSGSTGVAALRLGCRVILIERDPAYAAGARERMREESASARRTSRPGKQVGLFAPSATAKTPKRTP